MMPSLSMQGFLHEEGSFGVFLLVTIILGGGAAVLAGRAIALTWRPWWQIVAYMLILGAAVRFIHFALFGGTLLVAALLCRRQRHLPGIRIDRFPGRACRANGQPISLDQSAERLAALAPQVALT